jgi:hypothetical protein
LRKTRSRIGVKLLKKLTMMFLSGEIKMNQRRRRMKMPVKKKSKSNKELLVFHQMNQLKTILQVMFKGGQDNNHHEWRIM